MKTAFLVSFCSMTRVVIEAADPENLTDQEQDMLVAKAREQILENVEDMLSGDNVDEWRLDEECPYGTLSGEEQAHKVIGKIRFLDSRKDAEWSFRLNDGRLIEILGFEKFSIRYNTLFSLETGDIIESPEGWDRVCGPMPVPPAGFTTLNRLQQQGLGETVYCYDDYEIELGYPRRLTKKKIQDICKEFKEHGFNVTPEAVRHNFSCWLGDLKSGYRDETNGYHLFSPCGCNDLSFRATTLDDRLDWQFTYSC